MSRLSLADEEMFDRLRIPRELVEAAQIERVTDEQARNDYGITGKGDMAGIVFPYFNGEARRVTCRLRRDHPPMEGEKPKAKYLCPYGDVRHLYFPPRAAALLSYPETEIVFVEAEKSALSLLAWAVRKERQILPIATGGCWGWKGRIGKTTDASGERIDVVGALPDLACVEGRKCTILFDSNVATNPKVEASRFAFAAALRKLKASEVLTPNLPMGDGINGVDDFISLRGDDALKAVLDSPSKRDWREKFHLVEELPEGEDEMLIDDVLPPGVTFIGGSSTVGKTWLALAMARALFRGEPFLGRFRVREPVNCLYLVPEMSAKSFKKRCLRMGISGERFRCQTVSDGPAIALDDADLLAAVRETRPVIFLDTSIRFSTATDENSATENQALARAIFALVLAGARAVVCLHHRSKESARAEEMTLENCLRGSTDLGALSDCVLGIQHDRGDGTPAYLKESRTLVRVLVRCVKARDFLPVDDFRLQLFPGVLDSGDFTVLSTVEAERQSETETLAALIANNRKAGLRFLSRETGIGRNRIKSVAAQSGWLYSEETGWTRNPS